LVSSAAIAAALAEALVLLAIDGVRLCQELARDLLVIAGGTLRRVRVTFVPSIAITPPSTKPASAHRPSTSPNRPASASSWR
jgi:hypothetical protein